MSLRRAGPGDADTIRALTRSVYSKWIAVIGREPRPMTANYELAVRVHWIDVVDEDDGIVALIEMIAQPGHLLIENIAVREDRQGKGLASALLQHAEMVARQSELPELRLYTNAAFASNLTFYGARGFLEFGRTTLTGGGEMVHFTKAVS